MRQAGYLAAACNYALDNNIPRLKDDNSRAKQIGDVIKTKSFAKFLKPVFTNIIIFQLSDDIKDVDFLSVLKSKGILAAPFGGNTIRFVTHLDITKEMCDEVCTILNDL